MAGTFKASIQGSQGTKATTGYICGILTEAFLGPPRNNLVFGESELSCVASGRSTDRKSVARITDFLVPFGASGILRADLIGILLKGIGLDAASVDNTGYYTHTITMDDDADMGWLSILLDIDPPSTAAWERAGIDGRLTSLTFTSNRQGTRFSCEGIALDEEDSAGSETSTNEIDDSLFTQASGASLTVNDSGASAIFTAIQEAEVTITNEYDEEDINIFDTLHAGLAPTRRGITGVYRGAEMSNAIYDTLAWDGGTGPSAAPATGDTVFKVAANANIAGEAVPRSLEFTIPSIEYTLNESSVRVVGTDVVRADVSWTMIDDTATPITIVLENTVAAY